MEVDWHICTTQSRKINSIQSTRVPQLRLGQELLPQAVPLHGHPRHPHKRLRVLGVLLRVVQGGGGAGPVVGVLVELEDCSNIRGGVVVCKYDVRGMVGLVDIVGLHACESMYIYEKRTTHGGP